MTALPAAVVERCHEARDGVAIRVRDQGRVAVYQLVDERGDVLASAPDSTDAMAIGMKHQTAAALAEFLRIAREQPAILTPLLEEICRERGLRLTPELPTNRMRNAGERVDEEGSCAGIWAEMLDSAPPLAELLEERDG